MCYDTRKGLGEDVVSHCVAKETAGVGFVEANLGGDMSEGGCGAWEEGLSFGLSVEASFLNGWGTNFIVVDCVERERVVVVLNP